MTTDNYININSEQLTISKDELSYICEASEIGLHAGASMPDWIHLDNGQAFAGKETRTNEGEIVRWTYRNWKLPRLPISRK